MCENDWGGFSDGSAAGIARPVIICLPSHLSPIGNHTREGRCRRNSYGDGAAGISDVW